MRNYPRIPYAILGFITVVCIYIISYSSWTMHTGCACKQKMNIYMDAARLTNFNNDALLHVYVQWACVMDTGIFLLSKFATQAGQLPRTHVQRSYSYMYMYILTYYTCTWLDSRVWPRLLKFALCVRKRIVCSANSNFVQRNPRIV